MDDCTTLYRVEYDMCRDGMRELGSVEQHIWFCEIPLGLHNHMRDNLFIDFSP
jgi:hypothetical protein